MDVTSCGCWLLARLFDIASTYELHLQQQNRPKQIRYMAINNCQSRAGRPLCSCLSQPSSLFISSCCPFILSLPPSLPRCRLNLCLFIVCRAELWVSMLRGRRGCCCCRVAHHNLHGFMSWRGKKNDHVHCKKRRRRRKRRVFWGNLQVQINKTCVWKGLMDYKSVSLCCLCSCLRCIISDCSHIHTQTYCAASALMLTEGKGWVELNPGQQAMRYY